MQLYLRLLFFLLIGFSSVSCTRDKAAGDTLADTKPKPDSNDKQLLAANEAIEKDPKNAANYKRRANIYLDRNFFDMALSDIDKAIALDTTSGEPFYLKARALRGKREIPAALKNAHKAELKGFTDPNLFLAMGEMYLIFKQYQKSIDYLNKSLEMAQFNEQAYFYKGLVYAESNDTARAISSFQTAIEQQPNYIEPYNALIRIYNAKKDKKMASQYLVSALRFAPNDPYLLFNKGVVLRNIGKTDSAMMSFEQALFYDTTMYLAAYNLGVVAYQKEDYAKAAPALQKAVNYNNQLPAVESMLAYSYERLGDFVKAEQYYIKASEKTPNDKEITEGFARVKAKNVAAATGKP